MQLGKLNYKNNIPVYNKRILHFFVRLFILVTLWFFCYALILKPARVIDRPLTYFLTGTVVNIINVISPSTPRISWVKDPERSRAYLVQNNQSVFEIWDVCNGIDLMFIYAGVIVLLPYSIKRKIFFSIGGIIAIIIANIIRICSLYLIYVYYRTAFDFSHHYLFTLLMYVLIFYGWLLFIKKQMNYEGGS
jgi:exosortase/archaeosortase family protein